jgi:HD-like signal output (HDOD) protein
MPVSKQQQQAQRQKVIIQLLLTSPIKAPIFHGVAVKLQQMLAKDDYKLETALRLVNEDPGLAAEMLKYANSAYNAGAAKITTIRSAMVRLGSQQIVNLAFSASLSSHKSTNPIIGELLANLWTHSHVVALASSWMALSIKKDNTERFKGLQEEEVYLAGLFHSIGKFYLLKEIDDLISKGVMVIDEISLSGVVAELNYIMGVKLIDYWNLPPVYAKVIEGKINPEWGNTQSESEVNAVDMIAMVRLSCFLHRNYREKGILIDESCIEYSEVKEECDHLGITDLKKVSQIIQLFSGV